jgi:Pathogenicity locus
MLKPKGRSGDDLQSIPGVGRSIALDLADLGYHRASDLRGQSPEAMYEAIGERRGVRQDRCLLYVFRCAVYYASRSRHDPEMLKWWNWKDTPRKSAKRRLKA